jgi:uncharacterized phiE125 gp8 family phage protein
MAGFISLADAKEQLRVLHDDEDTRIQRLIDSASKHVELMAGWVAGLREATFAFDRFARQLELRLRPIDIDTIAVTYLDPAGEEQTFTDFRAFEQHGTVRLAPAVGACWPCAADVPAAITVTADAGFDWTAETGAADAPDHVKHAVRVCVSSWFQDSGEGPIPDVVLQLLDDDRARRV